MKRRVVVTGMSVVTPLGDSLDAFLGGLLAGRSAISRWRFFDDPRVYSKVGGDLSDWDWKGRLASFDRRLPDALVAKARKLLRPAPFATRISVLTALEAWHHAGLSVPGAAEPTRVAAVLAGHNLNEHYLLRNHETFVTSEPDWIDAQSALLSLDTDHAASIGDVLGAQGACYTLGGACASANIALRAAMDEIRYHEHDVAVLTGAPLEFSPMGLHAMALLGAITTQSFNDTPERASRPYDVHREGFVPTHGSGTLILESLEHATARGATVYGELLGCVATSDANHLPNPSPDGQARTLRRLFDVAGIAPEEVDFVSAHATSTPQGDLSELQAIRAAFGRHAERLKLNAPKSMLGHTCWSAPVVETVAALLQARAGMLHPSINIDEMDPAVDLDVCAGSATPHAVRTFVKNAFGFGGLNCCAAWRISAA